MSSVSNKEAVLPAMEQTEQQRILDLEEQLEQEKKAHEETKTRLEIADRKAFDNNVEVLHLKDQLHQQAESIKSLKASNKNEERFVKLELELKDHKEETAKQLEVLKEQIGKGTQETELPEKEELIAKYQQLQEKLRDSEKREQMKDQELKDLQNSCDENIQELQKTLDDEKSKLKVLKEDAEKINQAKDQKIKELQVKLDQIEDVLQKANSAGLEQLNKSIKSFFQQIELKSLEIEKISNNRDQEIEFAKFLLESSQENSFKSLVVQQIVKLAEEEEEESNVNEKETSKDQQIVELQKQVSLLRVQQMTAESIDRLLKTQLLSLLDCTTNAK